MIKIIKGDITQLPVDAIVNAANNSLLGGGGVDGAIHRVGGPQILEDCRKIIAAQGGCKTGDAVITRGGNLPATYVIHTVGPVWQGGNNNEEALLASAYHSSLLLAIQHNIQSIAFPNISTGVYHFPKHRAATIAIQTVQAFVEKNKLIKEVWFVCYDEENYGIYLQLLSSQ